jgi:hypothetical protein
MVKIKQITNLENEALFMKRHYKNKISWKKSVLSAIESFKDYNLESVDEFKMVVPHNPLEHPSSAMFMEHVKKNSFDEARVLLDLHPSLVYEFDQRFQTALHWAAKRGYIKLVCLLIEKG